VAGAEDLVRLTRLFPSTATVTLIGHSYGSVVVGYAAPKARADNLVLIASPGVDVPSVADLHTPARVWAARGPRDPIGLVPSVRIAGLGHGADPVSAGFGARTFATGEISGHDHYYQPGSESLANLARIALGRSDQVILAGRSGGSR
jgi:pimeloyl-ACP methyl ester carboxylesterase